MDSLASDQDDISGSCTQLYQQIQNIPQNINKIEKNIVKKSIPSISVINMPQAKQQYRAKRQQKQRQRQQQRQRQRTQILTQKNIEQQQGIQENVEIEHQLDSFQKEVMRDLKQFQDDIFEAIDGPEAEYLYQKMLPLALNGYQLPQITAYKEKKARQLQQQNLRTQKVKISLEFDKILQNIGKEMQDYLISSKQMQKQKQIIMQVPVGNVNVAHKIYFPFQPYQIQKKYMKVLITALQNKQNCLLESPTGTGKTQCLLNGVLSWVQSDYNRRRAMKSDVSKIKILYLSRTHSQLTQVQNELSKTCFRPTMAVIGSRDHLCINENLSQLKGNDKNNQCYKAIKNENRFKFLQTKEDKTPAQLLKRICGYHITEQNTVNKFKYYNMQKKIIDLQKIKQYGEKISFCPYFYPMHIKEYVDVFFMPYNYLLNEQLLKKYSQIVANSIVIFDQGHNVPQAACSGKTLVLTNTLLNEVIRQIKINLKIPWEKLMNKQNQIRHSQLKQNKIKMQSLIKKCEVWLAKIINYNFSKNLQEDFSENKKQRQYYLAVPYSKTIQYFKQQFIEDEVQTDQKAQKIRDQMFVSLEQLRKMQNQIIQYIRPMVTDILLIIGIYEKQINGQCENLKKLALFLQKILSLSTSISRNPIEEERFHYRVFLKRQMTQEEQVCSIQLVCLNPALMFQNLLSMNPRNIILTSGTLAPLNTWSCQLKVPFLYQLQNKHVIKPQQLQLMIVKKGIGNNRFNFSYANTNDNKDIFKDLAHSVVRLIKKIPNGVLMVFPSYKFLKQFENQLRQQKLYDQLNQSKQIFSQSKSLSEGYLKRYVDKAKERGAIMFCVCRGKVSEGIDFTDQLCRAVIFVGVPYPNIKDPMITQKMSYLNDLNRKTIYSEFQSIKGQQWYELQTMRAVNQAIGRVIRHANDFGTIYLLDERFSGTKLSKYFPKWAKHSVQHNENFQRTLSSTQNFFNSFMQTGSDKKSPQQKDQTSITKKKTNAFTLLMGKKEKKL